MVSDWLSRPGLTPLLKVSGEESLFKENSLVVFTFIQRFKSGSIKKSKMIQNLFLRI